MEDTEVKIVDGKAEVTKTTSEITIYALEELDAEIQSLQDQINRLEEKKQEKVNIRGAFEK